MVLTIISLSLIVVALVVILFILFKKFPALAILDINNIPGEKEAKFKEKIIKQRVERDLARWTDVVGRTWLFASRHLGGFLQALHNRLKKVKINHKKGLRLPWAEKQKRLKGLLLEASDLMKNELFNEAEEKILEIISLDQKNLSAFFQLGNLYENQKKWTEARQTYEHALKLARQLEKDQEDLGDVTRQEIYFSLAVLEKELENFSVSLDNLREALDLEPNNPRYLDLILDLSIIKKDKELALDYWQKLAEVNPDNNKLTAWQEKIAAL